MICPLLSKSGSEPSECVKQQCAWFIIDFNNLKGECAVFHIASWMSALERGE